MRMLAPHRLREAVARAADGNWRRRCVPPFSDLNGSPVWQRAVARLVVTDLAFLWGNKRG